MKKRRKPWLFVTATVLAILNLLCYFAIRSMWSGIIRETSESMPYILLAVLVATTLGAVLFLINKRYPLLITIWTLLIDILFLGLNGYIISETLDAYYYFIREFLYGAAFFGVIALIIILWIQIPKLKFLQKRWVPSLLLILLFAIGVFWQYDLSLYNEIGTPAVYAVGNKYQIVFTTHAKGTAWVEINGKEYNETYAGYRESENKIHKISVSMDILDEAGSYTIHTRSMMLRGPYCALQGKQLSETYNWKGVNSEDGLNYYVFSDTHNTTKTPYEAATYFGDDLDFLILCGDHASWVDREADLTQALRLAGRITKGEIPVVYARGNHETKGVRANELYKYVGADGEKFYYTFRLKNVWGVVLDIGENHNDNFAEYYGAAKFRNYRKNQTKFLDTVLSNAEKEFNAPGVDYRIAVCHVPITVKYVIDHADGTKDDWLERLNEMKITMCYSGHVHELWYIDETILAGKTLIQTEKYSGKAHKNDMRIMSDTDFSSILVSRRSDGQLLKYKNKILDTAFWGLAVTSDGESTTMKYTNHNHDVLQNIISPWYTDTEYGSEITIKNVK